MHDLGLWLEIDGQRVQTGSTATMIFRIPQIIAYLTRFPSLQSGDVISTGTPPGVGLGMKPPATSGGRALLARHPDGPGEQTQRGARMTTGPPLLLPLRLGRLMDLLLAPARS